MLFMHDCGYSRTIFLFALVALLSINQPANAGSEHKGGGDAATVLATPGVAHISAQSEGYQIIGMLKDGLLTLDLKRTPEGLPVTDAKIELTIDGETGLAAAREAGNYTYRSAALGKEGEREVIISITDGSKTDLLIGVFADRAGTETRTNHAGHDDHEGHGSEAKKKISAGGAHDDHGAEDAVELTPEVMQEFGVVTEKAAAGSLAVSIFRPAEIIFNLDRFTHVVPRVAGIAVSIKASQGDTVRAGQVLAVLESRELAELKAAYLAARERVELAKDDFERVQSLAEKKITSRKSYLTSRSSFAEARISLRSAKQKLNSIGVSDKALTEIVRDPDAFLTHYEIVAPMNGTVTQRHLVQGELVSNDREAFVIADLSSIWVNISIYSNDIQEVVAGLPVSLLTEMGQTASGNISFVSPDVNEQTRTATARVVIANPPAGFRPGMFIKAKIDIANTQVSLRIPKEALQVQDGKEVVFIQDHGAFQPRPVEVGRRNGQYVEVIGGLKPGDVYAAKGAFLIKSQLSKASFGDGHNH
jgi:cobalt-zinc-cadmium efflux system membrane fusion protein